MTLLSTDTLGNVLLAPDRGELSTLRLNYLPFGGHTSAPHNHMAMHGQLNERPLDGYLLGNGYRLYLSQVMRFVQADSLSPFGAGGVNAYAFCGGDPLNRTDSSGRMFSALKPFAKAFKIKRIRHSKIPGNLKNIEPYVHKDIKGLGKFYTSGIEIDHIDGDTLIVGSKLEKYKIYKGQEAIDKALRITKKNQTLLPRTEAMADLLPDERGIRLIPHGARMATSRANTFYVRQMNNHLDKTELPASKDKRV